MAKKNKDVVTRQTAYMMMVLVAVVLIVTFIFIVNRMPTELPIL